jgi:hypothetical protein
MLTTTEIEITTDEEFHFTVGERSIYKRQPCDPYRLLALAVIRKAMEDAQGGDRGAVVWLLDTGIDWLAGCGINIEPEGLTKILSKVNSYEFAIKVHEYINI